MEIVENLRADGKDKGKGANSTTDQEWDHLFLVDLSREVHAPWYH